jgi:hypothetical protein
MVYRGSQCYLEKHSSRRLDNNVDCYRRCGAEDCDHRASGYCLLYDRRYFLLESHGIFLPKLATVSIMRSASPAPHTLFRHIYAGTNSKNCLATGLAAVLTVTTIYLQFTSTALLADVGTGLVIG